MPADALNEEAEIRALSDNLGDDRRSVYYRLAMQRANLRNVVVTTAIATLALGVVSTRAEQVDLKRLNTTPQTQPRLIIRTEDLFPLTPPTRLGMFTMVPPETNGEVVRVSVPIGELVSRAARAISDANHRRAERKADERVRKDLEQFITAAANTRDATRP